MRFWRRKIRPGWVCEYGRNHYLDGCRLHGCRNRDGIFQKGPLKEPTMKAVLDRLLDPQQTPIPEPGSVRVEET